MLHIVHVWVGHSCEPCKNWLNWSRCRLGVFTLMDPRSHANTSFLGSMGHIRVGATWRMWLNVHAFSVTINNVSDLFYIVLLLNISELTSCNLCGVLTGDVQPSVARHAASGPRDLCTASLSHTPQTDVWVTHCSSVTTFLIYGYCCQHRRECVLRKDENKWLGEKGMDYELEGVRPRGRPQKTREWGYTKRLPSATTFHGRCGGS